MPCPRTLPRLSHPTRRISSPYGKERTTTTHITVAKGMRESDGIGAVYERARLRQLRGRFNGRERASAHRCCRCIERPCRVRLKPAPLSRKSFWLARRNYPGGCRAREWAVVSRRLIGLRCRLRGFVGLRGGFGFSLICGSGRSGRGSMSSGTQRGRSAQLRRYTRGSGERRVSERG